MHQLKAVEVEYKFADRGAELPPGEFLAYGSVFGNVDAHGDVIAPGAFAETLAKRKAQGRGQIPMHAMHGIFGGDGLPVGVWKSVEEDSTGLRVHGRISGATTTDQGKLNWERLRDGAYGGCSIGYTPIDFVRGKAIGEPKRLLKKVDLHEISLVDDPSNALAQFDEIKRARVDSRGDLEALLQNVGLPRNAARKLAAGGWPALAEEEPDEPDRKGIISPVGALAIMRKLNSASLELKSIAGLDIFTEDDPAEIADVTEDDLRRLFDPLLLEN